MIDIRYDIKYNKNNCTICKSTIEDCVILKRHITTYYKNYEILNIFQDLENDNIDIYIDVEDITNKNIKKIIQHVFDIYSIHVIQELQSILKNLYNRILEKTKTKNHVYVNINYFNTMMSGDFPYINID